MIFLFSIYAKKEYNSTIWNPRNISLNNNKCIEKGQRSFVIVNLIAIAYKQLLYRCDLPFL